MAVLLDQPFGVVAGDEGADGIAGLVDGPEDAAMHDLLFQRAEEALYDAVRLGLADEGVARRHAPEPDLLLEDVRHEVAAVVVAERQAAGGPGAEVAEPPAGRHADGLDRLVAGAALGHVPAEQFGVPVLGDAGRGRARCGESRACSRIRRSTRLRETRMPSTARSRAQMGWTAPNGISV